MLFRLTFPAAAFALALLFALLIAGTSDADTPLPPPEDFTQTAGDYRIEGDASGGFVRITNSETGNATSVSYRTGFVASEDGEHLLILPMGLNLIASEDPNQVVFEVFKADGTLSRVTFSEFARTGDLPRTASHFLLYTTVGWADGSFVIALGDGRSVYLRP